MVGVGLVLKWLSSVLLYIAQYLIDVAKFAGPAFVLFGAVVTWIYQTASARLGVVDQFNGLQDTTEPDPAKKDAWDAWLKAQQLVAAVHTRLEDALKALPAATAPDQDKAVSAYRGQGLSVRRRRFPAPEVERRDRLTGTELGHP